MKLTPITILVPGVRPTADRNVFEVKSRSKDKWWRVDADAKQGIGICSCPDYQLNKNQWCYHNNLVSRWIRIVAMQGSLTKMQKK